MSFLKTEIARRALISRSLALPAGLGLAGFSACPTPAPSTAKVTIYSPAPANTALHMLNRRLADAAAFYPALQSLEVVPLALPQSVNSIANLPPQERAQHWPIVTTLDFGMARSGIGPAWHRYDRANAELKFVSFLCDTGFGIAIWGQPVSDPQQLRGKRIAAPPRASAVRLMTEILLRDGWGILDDVTLVAMTPAQVPAARAAGEIDGTSWGLVGPTPLGHRPTLPQNPSDPFHYVPVDSATLARINTKHSFKLTLSPLLQGAPPLISFAQGLAVWEQSDRKQVEAMLELIAARGKDIPGFAKSVQEMAGWPGLTPQNMHPAALDFYRSRRIGI